jgi:hypothetical protein
MLKVDCWYLTKAGSTVFIVSTVKLLTLGASKTEDGEFYLDNNGKVYDRLGGVKNDKYGDVKNSFREQDSSTEFVYTSDDDLVAEVIFPPPATE